MKSVKICDLSVIIPVYNAESYIEECIESITRQTFTAFDLIIVDDGSTDKSLNIIKRAALKDTRIRYYTKNNSGVVDTLNFAIEQCKTDLIARIDADDIAMPDRLERQYDYMKRHPYCVALGTQIQMFSDKEKDLGIDPRPTDDLNLKLFLGYGCAIPGPTVMFRKSVVEEIGGFRNETKGVAEDYDVWARMVLSNRRYTIANLPDILHMYRINPKGISLTNQYDQYKMTVRIGDEYRHARLRQLPRLFVSLKSHKTWLEDRMHIKNVEQREDLMRVYYTTIGWYLNDQRISSPFFAKCNQLLLKFYTFLFNRQDLHYIGSTPAEHAPPQSNG